VLQLQLRRQPMKPILLVLTQRVPPLSQHLAHRTIITIGDLQVDLWPLALAEDHERVHRTPHMRLTTSSCLFSLLNSLGQTPIHADTTSVGRCERPLRTIARGSLEIASGLQQMLLFLRVLQLFGLKQGCACGRVDRVAGRDGLVGGAQRLRGWRGESRGA